MKKTLLVFILLLLIIPTSVQASGLLSFVPFADKAVVEHTVVEKSHAKKTKVCDKGFVFDFSISKCKKIVVPEHGILDEEGHSFRCEFGFRKNLEKNLCEKVELPAHASISGSGDDFQCDRDYRK